MWKLKRSRKIWQKTMNLKVRPILLSGPCSVAERNILQAIIESYERHFGPIPVALTQISRDAVDRRGWTHSKHRLGKLGSVVNSSPEGAEPSFVVNDGEKIPVSVILC
jgi:hypothetical protein